MDIPKRVNDELLEKLNSKGMNYPGDLHNPEYSEVWFWLWREKDVKIEIEEYQCTAWVSSKQVYCDDCGDPEEAIIAAIEYLCYNDLIK